MITLDQVLLLQEKVEAAVEKITSLKDKVLQLESENDALRSKCAELSKACSEKTELVSELESAQARIESTLLKTLSSLDSVEDKILDGQTEPDTTATEQENQTVTESPSEENTQEEAAVIQESENVSEPGIFDSPENQSTTQEQESSPTPPETDLNGQFDIF